MAVRTIVLTGTTDASGDATADTPAPETGRVVKVTVIGDDMDASANLDLNPIYYQVADGAEVLGQDLVDHEDVGTNAVTELYPSRAIQDVAGTGELYASSGETVPTHQYIDGAALRATIAAGGNAKSFAIRITIES
jgi:hypothetical protein